MGEKGRLRVEHGVRVAFVEVVGAEVAVDLYGGEGAHGGLCGTVRFRFPTSRRDAMLETLNGWRDAGTRLTYVDRGDEVELLADGWLEERYQLAG